MTLRERITDWISGGMYENERTAARILCLSLGDARAEAANIAAQRDEAIARAEVAESKIDALAGKFGLLEYDNANGWKNSELYSTALRAILTARNIREARKIAREALGEAE